MATASTETSAQAKEAFILKKVVFVLRWPKIINFNATYATYFDPVTQPQNLRKVGTIQSSLAKA